MQQTRRRPSARKHCGHDCSSCLPTAWLTARNAWRLYHALPPTSRGFLIFRWSWYSFFRTTCAVCELEVTFKARKKTNKTAPPCGFVGEKVHSNRNTRAYQHTYPTNSRDADMITGFCSHKCAGRQRLARQMCWSQGGNERVDF